jgi:hypothetical protein
MGRSGGTARSGGPSTATHGFWGGSSSLGLSLNGDTTLMWYSDQVDPDVVAEVLAGIGAVAPSADDDAEPAS